MTKEELAEKISNWEREAGEAFTDYFMHDRVNDVSWAFWLLGKGFTERANIIIDLLNKGETCLDQSLLYEIHSATVEDDYGDHGEANYAKLGTEETHKLYDKDVDLWAEFLLATAVYTKRITEFFEEEGND